MLSYRSEAHDMPSTHVCLHLAVSQLELRDHYTVHHFRGVKMAESNRVGSRLMSFILLFDCQEAFHCCLVVACIHNRINMISIQCHRVGEWSAGKPECGNCIVRVWGNHDYSGLNEVAIPFNTHERTPRKKHLATHTLPSLTLRKCSLASRKTTPPMTTMHVYCQHLGKVIVSLFHVYYLVLI